MADCGNTSEPGLTALIDLIDPATYGGFSGRLYVSNSNNVPAGHNTQALAAANAIVRRDAAGVESPTGKKVLLSCGMSNTTQEFDNFMAGADPASDVVIVDGAQSARDATEWSDSGSDVWATVDSRLAAKGVTAEQVSAIWCKHAVAGVTGTFPTHAETLQGYLKDFVMEVKTRYPNCKLIFFSSRTYGGYNDTAGNPEPYAYESGFAVKWLIESQTEATDPDLAYADPTPVLLWGPYLWANGTTANSEGLSWDCSDFESDGLHPDTTGEAKVAAKLETFFTTSIYTAWYRSANAIETLSFLDGAGAGTDDDEYTLPSFTLQPYQLAVVGVLSRHGSATPVAPTLAGHGLTWTQITTRPFHSEATPRGRLSAYWAINGAVESTDTVVATFAGPQTQVVCQMQAVGLVGISLEGDAIAQFNSNSLDTQTSLQVELNDAPEAESSVVAFWALATLSNNLAPKSGWDERYDTSSSSPTTKLGTHTNDLFDATAEVTWGANNSNAAGIAIEIKAAVPEVGDGAMAGSSAGVGAASATLLAVGALEGSAAGAATASGTLVPDPLASRDELSVQVIELDGLEISWTDLTAAGHKALVTPQSQILIKNGATGFTLTIQTTLLVDEDLELVDREISIAADEDYAIRLPNPDLYIQADGLVYFDYSDVTDGQVAVVV